MNLLVFFIPPWSWSVYTEHAVLPRCPPPPLHYPALYRVIILTYSVGHTVKETPLHNTIRFLTLGKCDTMAGFRTQHNITQVPPPPLHYPALYLVIVLTYSVGHTVKETPLHNTIRFLTLGKCDTMAGFRTQHNITQVPPPPPPLHYPALYLVIVLTYSVGHTVKETPLHNTIRFLTLGKCDTMAGFRTQHNITQVPPPPPPPTLPCPLPCHRPYLFCRPYCQRNTTSQHHQVPHTWQM